MERDEGFSLVVNKTREKRERRRKRRETQQTVPLAPRTTYFRLAFPSGTTAAKKHAWWNKLGKHPPFQHQVLDVVKSSFITSDFVYVNRRHERLIKELQEGKIGQIQLLNKDEPQRPRPYKEYIVNDFPLYAELKDAYNLKGVARVFLS